MYFRLCNMTGLSDEQRADFKLMKAVGAVTLAAPPKRIQGLNAFSARLQSVPQIVEDFRSWDLKFQPTLQSFQGRTLLPETIIAGNQQTDSYKMENADWGRMINRFKLFGAVNCPTWAVIYCTSKSFLVIYFRTLNCRLFTARLC